MKTHNRKTLSPLLLAGAALATMLASQSAFAVWKFAPRFSFEWVNGQTTESVYYVNPNGGKLSELDWNLDSLFRINLGGTVQPADWIRINLDYAFKIDEGNADMTDYDWFYSFRDWSHRSEHDDTVINKANRFEIGAEFPIVRVRQVLFTGGLGYRIDDWEWEARGGNYIYSGYDFRDEIGSFPPGEKGITYENKFSSFFLSLGAEAEIVERFTVGARFIYSPEARIETTDTHHMRDLEFSEDFDDTTMYGVELAGAWRINEQLSVFGEYSYTKYNEVTGPTTITDKVTGVSIVDGATEGGLDHSSNTFSIGISYRF